MDTIGTFNNKIAFQLLHLAYYFCPPAQVEITNAKVHTFYADIADYIIETIFKFYFNIIVYTSHSFQSRFSSLTKRWMSYLILLILNFVFPFHR